MVSGIGGFAFGKRFVRVKSATLSQFCVRPTSKRWFLKIVQVTMKHDSFYVM